MEDHTFSYYFSRKFADFAGVFMVFFAMVMLSVLFMQDMRKNTYELLHTKPVSAGSYVLGKIAGGFAVCLISLLFRNPLPAVPLLVLHMVYSNMGSRNAEGLYGYYGRPLAIMVRFPGQLFDTSPPPMVLLNQSFLILASVCIIFLSVWLWKRPIKKL